MKDTEIHIGLEQKEIRDYISISLNKLMEEALSLKRKHIPLITNDVYWWRILDTKAEIEHQQKLLETHKSLYAIHHMMKHYNWSEYDVSDYVEITDDSKLLRLSFIGTKDEYEKLFKKIKS